MLISPAYLEQMALDTGVNKLFVRDGMRKNLHDWQMTEVRD